MGENKTLKFISPVITTPSFVLFPCMELQFFMKNTLLNLSDLVFSELDRLLGPCKGYQEELLQFLFIFNFRPNLIPLPPLKIFLWRWQIDLGFYFSTYIFLNMVLLFSYYVQVYMTIFQEMISAQTFENLYYRPQTYLLTCLKISDGLGLRSFTWDHKKIYSQNCSLEKLNKIPILSLRTAFQRERWKFSGTYSICSIFLPITYLFPQKQPPKIGVQLCVLKKEADFLPGIGIKRVLLLPSAAVVALLVRQLRELVDLIAYCS